jgi:hypothetical protein
LSTKLAAPLHESVGPILAEFDARQITSRIRQWVKAFPADDVKRVFFGRIWLAMGYDSWAEWCDSKLDGFKLPKVERREIVSDLHDAGMSQRATADVIGAAQSTVHEDLKAGDRNRSPVSDRTVTAQDGKSYPTSKPQRETIEDRLGRIGPEAEATEADQPVDKGEDFFCKRSGSFNLALRIARKNLEAIVVRRTPEEAVKLRNLLEKSLRELEHDQKEGGK